MIVPPVVAEVALDFSAELQAASPNARAAIGSLWRMSFQRRGWNPECNQRLPPPRPGIVQVSDEETRRSGTKYVVHDEWSCARVFASLHGREQRVGNGPHGCWFGP